MKAEGRGSARREGGERVYVPSLMPRRTLVTLVAGVHGRVQGAQGSTRANCSRNKSLRGAAWETTSSSSFPRYPFRSWGDRSSHSASGPGIRMHVLWLRVAVPLNFATLVCHAWLVGLYQSVSVTYNASSYVQMHSDRNFCPPPPSPLPSGKLARMMYRRASAENVDQLDFSRIYISF